MALSLGKKLKRTALLARQVSIFSATRTCVADGEATPCKVGKANADQFAAAEVKEAGNASRVWDEDR